jgi:hypothetical protein
MTRPDLPDKHNSYAKFTDEMNIQKFSKGRSKLHKIRWWIDDKRKEEYRKSDEDTLVF